MHVANTLAYLARFDPAALAAIRARYPDSSAALVGNGVVLGAADDGHALFDATVAMLRSVKDVADRAMTEVTARLKTARRIEIIGSVISLLSSGAVVGATAGLQSLWGGAIFGALSFMAAAAPQIVNWLRQSTIGAGAAAENLVKLRDSGWDANVLLRRLEAAGDAGDDNAMMAEADALAKIIYLCLGDLGYNVGS